MSTIGIVLVSRDGYYLDSEGDLPERPKGDKKFLVNLVYNKIVLCSTNTLKDLPRSIYISAAGFTTDPTAKYDVNLGINTFKSAPPDIMLVVRSNKNIDMSCGVSTKFFRLDWLKTDYTRIGNSKGLIAGVNTFIKKDKDNAK